MKKFFEKAEMEIVEFDIEDVITTSGDVDMSDIEQPATGDDNEEF